MNNRNFVMTGLIIAIFVIAQSKTPDQTVPKEIRAEQLVLVDKKGKVRASLKVEESGETVFRLMDANGTIRVKLGASEDGSGFVLLNDSTNVGIHALAKGQGTFLSIESDGRKKRIEP